MTIHNQTADAPARPEISTPVKGQPLSVGGGFEALTFRQDRFGGLMDPLVMVDHFVMTAPTFGAHPHAGMSAVSVLFEDSEGLFHNRDSLGNDFTIAPGDLYWLKAGSGAVHDEAPLPGARIHALQVFVNLPAARKADAPASLHVPARQMPIIDGDGYRVRVVLGACNGTEGAVSPALPMTILDIGLTGGGSFTHHVPASQAAWLLAVRGDAEVHAGDTGTVIRQGTALAVHGGNEALPIRIQSVAGAQVAMLQGAPVREPFVHQGPFVMSTLDEIEAVKAAHAAGALGTLE